MGKKQRNYMTFRRPRTRAVRALNNIYVVTTLTINALTDVKNQLRSEKGAKLNFEVPVVSGERIVVPRQRTKILQLLDNAIARDLYRQSLITAVATTEDYLTQILTIILRWFPHKLKLAVTGSQTERKIDLDLVLEAQKMDDLFARIIERRLISVFYGSPQRYFDYIQSVLAFELSDEVKISYAEVKATRDLLVHNSGIVNQVYLKKAGSRARVPEGETIPLDDQYFSESIRCMKRVVTKVYSGCLDKYGDINPTQATNPEQKAA
ncbi:MAG: hypothetical protein E3J21_03310 [Anaerolineales bacterium]|nr:MAG: hypothetical protein E3J21_03310 [Anaerolineales bacterium]